MEESDKIEEPITVHDKIEEPITVHDKIEEPIMVHDKIEEPITVNEKMNEFDASKDETEASNNVNGENSEVEDLDVSESEEIPPSDNIPLNIDCNARIVTKEVKCDNEGDDCDMQFVEKSSMCLLSHRGSEPALHTSTEDLNVSDEEQSCVAALQSINLDGLASTSSKKDKNSSKKDKNSLSTSNFSHTVFKDEFSFEAEYLSDEEIRCALREKSGGDDKLSKLNPELKLEGLLLTFRPPPSFFYPSSHDVPDTFSVNNVSPNSTTDKNEKLDLNDDQNFDLSKSEYSDGHNTDAEDISFGSLEDVIETSKNKNPFGKGYNAFNLPESVSEFSCGNGNDEKHSCSGGSRRSSPTEFLTEDETVTLENFTDHGKKRIKKFEFRVIDTNEKSEDSLTDEEDIEDQ